MDSLTMLGLGMLSTNIDIQPQLQTLKGQGVELNALVESERNTILLDSQCRGKQSWS
jgi:hypothetical protein